MIGCNQYNQIAADRQNVCTTQGGVVLEDSSVESDFKDKSAVNIIANQQIEWTCLSG